MPTDLGHANSILLIEDNYDSARALTYLLRSFGYTIHTAANGGEAFRLLSDRRFNAVITDINLPDVDGCDLMQRIHTQFHIQGIALTGTRADDLPANLEDFGFAAHFLKPMHFDDLKNALTRVMTSSEGKSPYQSK